MRFSDLTTDFPGVTNRLYERRGKLQNTGAPVVDLVRGNVNDHGIVFPRDVLSEALADAAVSARTYQPDPLGQFVAREAVATYSHASPQHILLTPGTSISYWYAFKLLCEPGDKVLCPTPSYPLFDYIARLAGVEITHYRLDEERNWYIDLDHLENHITERTRAIVLISPHNPTGMVAERDQIEGLATIAGRHKLPIIGDEVFREFVFDDAIPRRPAETRAPLVFTLNGFSKMFALPGLKLGWMAVSGEAALVEKAMTTLELMSDTFLPVNEIAQFSVPAIFKNGREFLAEYRSRIREYRETAVSVLGSGTGIAPRGGFYMVVPYERDIEEEDLTIELIDEEHVLVHPGYFYDIEGRHLVFSFVNNPETLREVLPRIKRHLQT